jgi:exoribonuclease R
LKSNPALVAALAERFAQIRANHEVAQGDVGDASLQAAAAQVPMDSSYLRRDATNIALVTLDPQHSTDLDQAYAVERIGDNLVLYYAIADIGAFVPLGSEIEKLAWQRGVTVYAPDGSVPLYPRILSKQRASLLPDGPRPAILLTVEIDLQGQASLLNVERAMVLSRAKLAYETVTDEQLGPQVIELSRRIASAEVLRGAFRIDRPAQEVVSDSNAPSGLRLEFAPKRSSEERNAALSLAANLAVARYFLEQGLGLFRVMDDPDPFQMGKLKVLAKAAAIQWQQTEPLANLVKQISSTNPHHVDLVQAIRRVGGGARYLSYPVQLNTPEQQKKNAGQAKRPWHSAIAASYAHATAPMRRLADRYVLELLVAQFAGDHAHMALLAPLLTQLPEVMAQAEHRANLVERDCVDLLETVMLQPFVGSILEATVIEIGRDNWQVQIAQPAVIRRIQVSQSDKAQLGATVKIKVDLQSESVAGSRTKGKIYGPQFPEVQLNLA